MSVRPCAKVMYTKTQERVKIIEGARRLTKLEPNEIFNDFAISREPFDEIDSNFFYFEGMDQKITPNPIGPEDFRTKISEVGAE